ncbi:protein starmaker-like [Osmerus mordax]|uniref:protein starmaker-like n=1 Tax=Osmerus mordax TaxID=8014 RepID=UPI0035106427
MIQSDQNILQHRPEQETVPDQDPESVKVSLPDLAKSNPDPGPEGPTCPTKQDTGAGETGHQEQQNTDISEQTGLLANPNNPIQVGSEPEAPKNQLDTNTEAKSEVPAEGHHVEISESCSTSPGGNKDGLKEAEKGIETRNEETERKTNDGGIDEDAMDQNGEEAIRKTEQEREHCVSESSPASILSPKKNQINGSTPDTVAVSKHAEQSQVQSEPNQSEHAGDLSQQAEDSAQSQTKPTDTSTPKLTSDTQPPAPTPTKPSAECNRSDPPSPSQVSMIQSDQKILQTRPEQETVPDQDPAVSVVSLPDQKSVVAARESITKEPTDQAIPDPGPEGPTCPTKQDTGAGETGHQKQPDTDISEQTGLLANPNNPTQVGSEAEALKNQLDTNTEAKPEDSEEANEDGAASQKMDSSATQRQTQSSPASTLSPTDGQLNDTPSDTEVSKPAETSQYQPEPNQSEQARDLDLSQQAEGSAQSQTKPTDTSTPKLTSDTQPPALTPTKPSAECNRSDPHSPSQASMIQSDPKILQPGQETVPDQDPAKSVKVSLPDQKSVVAACESITKEPTDQAIPDPGPEGPTCPTKQDTGAGETGHQKQPDTDISEQTGLVANPNNPTQVGSEAEALKNQLDTNKEGKPESCSTSPGGEEGDEDELETRDGETERSPASTLSSKEDQINGSTPDTATVSKHAEPGHVQPEPDDSKAVGDVDNRCQQKPNSQSCSISPGGVVGSEEGSKEAEEEMEAGDVEKEKPEGGVDHSMGINRSMETEDEENKTSAVEVGNSEQQSMKEEKTGTDESAEQHPDPGEKADVSSQSDTVETAEVEKNAKKELDDKKDGGGIKVNSQMDGAGSDEQADDNSDEKAKGTEQGETNRKLED